MHSCTFSARRAAALAFSLAAALAAGCNSRPQSPVPLSEVKGTVKYNGQPLAEGTITFMPIGGTNSATGDIQNGEYSLSTFVKGDGAPPGEYKVAVTAWDKQPEMGVEGVPAIPRKYLDANQSQLTATISSEKSQTQDFDLKPE